MNKFNRIASPAVFAALALLALALPACAQRGVTAALSLDQTVFLADEDMDLKVQIINRSGRSLALGGTPDWITFSVQGAEDYIAPKIGELPVVSPFVLGSGMAATRKFNPAPYIEIRRPGRYTINATIKIPQWKQAVACKPVSFTIVNGTPLAGFSGLEFGLPSAPGSTNAPESRQYRLLKVAYQEQLKLYFQLTDKNGKTLRCYPLGHVLSFSAPEAQLDHFNNLHILWQTGARDFTYLAITTDGDLLMRQTYVYTETRPRLKLTENSNIAVEGGVRKYTAQDLPIAAESARQ
ncbi:MAG TPA: hypothetical protein VHB20_10700 [Verrucomicrobiae bacterium]|jgi:hypothetical protein|nr:hypothetical protein [Verrucomicrobiae bacterium]